MRQVSAAVFLVLLAGSALLAERDIEFLLEADFAYGLMLAAEHLMKTGSWALVPIPGPHVYLDAQYIIYGAVIAAIRPLVSLPSDLSYSIAVALGVNALSYATGCWLFWRSVLEVTGKLWLALLAAVVLFLSPPMLAINLLRLDFLIFGPLLALIHCSIVFAIGRDRTAHAIGLGLSLGILAGLKVNGIMYAAIPALALVAHRQLGRHEFRFIAIAFACFNAVLAISFTRYFVYLGAAAIPPTLMAAVASVGQWALMYPNGWHYYFTDLFLGHSAVFVVGYLLASVGTIVCAAIYRRPFDLFVALNLIFFGIFSLYALKYTRGGYHLLPFYILALIVVFRWNVKSLQVAVAGVLALSFAVSALNYAVFLQEQAKRPERINAVKREPRKWLAQHVQPGTTVCIMRHSNWTIPPVEDLGLKWTSGPFDFPYLEPDKLAAYPIPDIDALPAVCPIIAFADFHQVFYSGAMQRASPERFARWKELYVQLEARYPPIVFQTDKSVGGVKRIEIHDLRPGRRIESRNE